MKSVKVSFDFKDRPDIVRMLKLVALRENTSQKDILVRALESYFSHQVEQAMISEAAERTFAEWDNQEDEIYDTF
jgi:hypothetical protein